MLMRRLLCAMLLLAPLSISAEVLELRYSDFTIWLDCEKRSATKFHYRLGPDVGNLKRTNDYIFDPDVAKNCQQTSEDTYRYPELGISCNNKQEQDENCVHRGHLVPYNHMDDSLIATQQSNYMTNILPQAKELNTGAWKKTEEITECYRDYSTVDIFGGPIWGKNGVELSNHSITMPDSYWKVLIRDDKVIAWIIPNSNEEQVGENDLPNFMVTIERIEKVTGHVIPIASKYKRKRGNESFWDTSYCTDNSPVGWWK